MANYFVDSELKKIDQVINEIDRCFANKEILISNKLVHSIIEDLDILNDTTTAEAISHPFFLIEYLQSLRCKARFYLTEDRANKVKDILKIARKQEKEEFARIRTFRPVGIYCGLSFKQADGYYLFLNDEPILVTKFLKEQLIEQAPGFPIRQEVRIMASIAFSLQMSSYSFNLLYQTYDIPSDLILDKGDISVIKVQAIIKILSCIKDNHGELNELLSFNSTLKFKFSTKYFSTEKAMLFYSSFDIQDDLLLRSSFLIIKSKMLWEDGGMLYAEDACSNLFIAIEGILHLIHRKISDGKKFEFKPTIDHITKIFPYGECWISLLKDIYEKRIQIVHPAESFWMPDLSADDYYDNYGIALDLIFYAVTGDLLSRDY